MNDLDLLAAGHPARLQVDPDLFGVDEVWAWWSEVDEEVRWSAVEPHMHTMPQPFAPESADEFLARSGQVLEEWEYGADAAGPTLRRRLAGRPAGDLPDPDDCPF